MDILLISPDYDNKKNNFPWGVLSLGSYLTCIKNYEAKLLDASIYSKAELIEKIKYYCRGIKIVGISMMSTDAHLVKNIIDYIKEIEPGVKIIVGGSHAMLAGRQSCLYKNIDFVAYAEGEYTLSALFEKIKSGSTDYDKIPGLIYKEGGLVKQTAPPESAQFYDINYGLLPESTRKTFSEYIQVLTGRGCSFSCTFCFNSVCGQKWRGRPMRDIINEIEKIISKYNSKIIYFRDENFFHSKERIREFISYYKEKKFNFKWRATCRASNYNKNFMDIELLKELESINCEVLKFGLESGSQRVLDYLKKGIKIDNVKKLIYDLGKIKKIKPEYSFMAGVPTETFKEYKETMKLIRFIMEHSFKVKIIGPQYFRVYPGGELYEEIKKKYNYSEPETFEEWAAKYSVEKEFLYFKGNAPYPWLSSKQYIFAKNISALVLFAQQDLRRYLKIKLFVHLPFILLSKIRIKLGWYGCLYDIRLAVFLQKLKKRIRANRVPGAAIV